MKKHFGLLSFVFVSISFAADFSEVKRPFTDKIFVPEGTLTKNDGKAMLTRLLQEEGFKAYDLLIENSSFANGYQAVVGKAQFFRHFYSITFKDAPNGRLVKCGAEVSYTITVLDGCRYEGESTSNPEFQEVIVYSKELFAIVTNSES